MPGPDQLTFDRIHLHPGDRVCVALSGGADSVALLRTLHTANSTSRAAVGVGLSAVHVHHGIRGEEADADQRFVEQLCGGLSIPLHLRHVDVPARAAAHRETLEEAARHARYEIFRTLLQSGETDSVVTAHTMDDQTETVLMKLLRGAWTEGLGGIHPILTIPISGKPEGRILRPFLCTRRREIEAYLQALGQTWREDASNADPAFTRNRLRHQLLPQLREFNPNLDQTLSNLAELAREDEARWQIELARILPALLLPGKPVRGGGRAVSTAASTASVAVEIERLRPLDDSLRRRILRAAARQLGANISFAETSRLLALCGFLDLPTVSAKPGGSLRISGDLVATRSVRELHLTHQPRPAAESATVAR